MHLFTFLKFQNISKMNSLCWRMFNMCIKKKLNIWAILMDKSLCLYMIQTNSESLSRIYRWNCKLDLCLSKLNVSVEGLSADYCTWRGGDWGEYVDCGPGSVSLAYLRRRFWVHCAQYTRFQEITSRWRTVFDGSKTYFI